MESAKVSCVAAQVPAGDNYTANTRKAYLDELFFQKSIKNILACPTFSIVLSQGIRLAKSGYQPGIPAEAIFSLTLAHFESGDIGFSELALVITFTNIYRF